MNGTSACASYSNHFWYPKSKKMSTIDPRTRWRSRSPLRRGDLARILIRDFIVYSFAGSKSSRGVRWRVGEQAEQSFGRGRVGPDRVAQGRVRHTAEHRRLGDRHQLAGLRAQRGEAQDAIGGAD